MKDNYGLAKFNTKTQKIDYPATVPKNRFPLLVSARPRKGLMVIPRQVNSINPLSPPTDICVVPIDWMAGSG